jgi:uncharacterized protein
VLFIDTGAFLARYLEKDQYHQKAQRLWKKVSQQGHDCVTSNFVLDECFTLLARRASYAFAAERAHAIYLSDALKIIRPQEEDERQALNLFEKFADQKVSFTDCISFALMKKKNIKKTFSFDQDFQHAGFELFV